MRPMFGYQNQLAIARSRAFLFCCGHLGSLEGYIKNVFFQGFYVSRRGRVLSKGIIVGGNYKVFLDKIKSSEELWDNFLNLFGYFLRALLSFISLDQRATCISNRIKMKYLCTHFPHVDSIFFFRWAKKGIYNVTTKNYIGVHKIHTRGT